MAQFVQPVAAGHEYSVPPKEAFASALTSSVAVPLQVGEVEEIERVVSQEREHLISLVRGPSGAVPDEVSQHRPFVAAKPMRVSERPKAGHLTKPGFEERPKNVAFRREGGGADVNYEQRRSSWCGRRPQRVAVRLDIRPFWRGLEAANEVDQAEAGFQ